LRWNGFRYSIAQEIKTTSREEAMNGMVQSGPAVGQAPFGVIPLSDALGAEIVGVDLCEPLGQPVFEAIRETWHAHGVLLLRGQVLDEPGQAAFGARFGELGKVLNNHNGRSYSPGVMYISNVREDGKLVGALPDGEMFFHSDQCYVERPGMATMLYAMEVPKRGGNTLFANMYTACETLPGRIRAKIEGKLALNVYDYDNNATTRGSEPREGVPSYEHPIVRTHPATGRKALYVNRLMTRRERRAAGGDLRSSGAARVHLRTCVDAGRPSHLGQSLHAPCALQFRRQRTPDDAPRRHPRRQALLSDTRDPVSDEGVSMQALKMIHALPALALTLALASPACADFNDKKPITFSVDGATATG
jgi:taurine dioxygenase